MKILIIGRGGREHAIAHSIAKSREDAMLYIAPGNPGMRALGKCIGIDEEDIEGLKKFALEENIDLTIVGPEIPLALGIVDIFTESNLLVFGPQKLAARIESSKEYAKRLMVQHHIPTAKYQYFSDLKSAEAFIDKHGTPIVIKANGLQAGKGVTVAMEKNEALSALRRIFEHEQEGVVIEEFLEGFEFSLIALVHGEKVYPFEVACDHKRAFNNDEGPNTGGMGAYCPSRKVTSSMVSEAMENIMIPTAKALVEDGCPFTGFLYGGLISTADGIKTIEFNARFGDPEAEVILPRLKSDLVTHIFDLLEDKPIDFIWKKEMAVGVVLASEGYPVKVLKQEELPRIENSKIITYHMGTEEQEGSLYAKGGRNLILVSLDKDLSKASEIIYQELLFKVPNGFFYRSDIGKKDLF